MKLPATQLERMKWSLKHAYENVPFYRKSFDDAGVHPDDLKTLADLAKFPFTVKQDLRDNYPFGLFAVPRENIARIHASSGTTGSRRLSAIPRTIWICGLALWRVACGPRACVAETCCITLTDTACSLAVWVCMAGLRPLA